MSADVRYMLFAGVQNCRPRRMADLRRRKHKCLFLGCSNKTLFTKTGKGLDLAHLLWALDIIDGQKENKSLDSENWGASILKDSTVALVFSTMAHLTLEIGLKTTKPENRKITNDISSTQYLRMPPGHTAVEQDYVRWVWENFLQEGSDWEAEDVVGSVWWWEGAEDIPRNTESLVSEMGRGAKCEQWRKKPLSPCSWAPRLRAVTCMCFLWKKN